MLTALAAEAETLVEVGSPECGVAVPPPAVLKRRMLPDGRDAWVGYTGTGPEAARAALAAFRDRPPKVVFFGGVAGGLRGDLAAGDLVLLDSVVREGGSLVETSRELTDAFAAALERHGVAARRKAMAVEVPRIASDPEAKRALARHFPEACVVAMEDHAVVAGARALGAQVVAFRVVLDGLGDHLPDLSPALDGAGRPRPLQFVRHLIGNPGTIRALPGLARTFGVARAKLDAAMEVALELVAGRETVSVTPA